MIGRNGNARRFREESSVEFVSRIVTQRRIDKGSWQPRVHLRFGSFRGISVVSPRDQLIISNAHPRSVGLKFDFVGPVDSCIGSRPETDGSSNIQTNWDPWRTRERERGRKRNMRRKINAQRTSLPRQGGIAKASGVSRVPEAGSTPFRATKDGEGKGEGRDGVSGLSVENLKFRRDERGERERDLTGLLSRLERSLVSTVVHLGPTNLSIVSRQISGNITDMF